MNIFVVGFIFIVSVLRFVHGFDLTITNPPSQCDDIEVTWSGGVPPFRLLIFPPGGSLRSIDIHPSSFQDGRGTFKSQLPFLAGQALVLSMSDAQGSTSGGISNVLTVGQSSSGASCNTTDPGVDFFYSLDSDLVQCQPYPFTSFTGAVLPITVQVIVPKGESFFIRPPSDDTVLWTANLTAGTAALFSVTDAAGRVGGVSSIRQVKSSNDVSCITSLPSSSLIAVSTSTSTALSASGSATNQDKDNAGNHRPRIGVIIGAAVAGGLVVLIAIIVFFVCSQKRRRRRTNPEPIQKVDLTYDSVSTPASEGVNHSNSQYTSIEEARFAAGLSPYEYPSLQSGAGSFNFSVTSPTPPVMASRTVPPQSLTSSSTLQNSSTISYTPFQQVQFIHTESEPGPYTGVQTKLGFYGSTPATASQFGDPHAQGSSSLPNPYLPNHQSLTDSQSFMSSPHQIALTELPYYRNSLNKAPGLTQNTFSTISFSPQEHRPPVVLHKDIEESDDPIELPPQYSERRTPLPGLATSEAG